LSPANITLNTTGTATGSIGVSGTGTTTRTVTLSNITGDGTLGISLAAGTATGASGSAAAAGPSATFSVDNTPPVLNSVTGPAAGSYRALQDLDFTVTYKKNVTVVINIGTPAIG